LTGFIIVVIVMALPLSRNWSFNNNHGSNSKIIIMREAAK